MGGLESFGVPAPRPHAAPSARRFSSHEPPFALCSRYVLHGGRTAGCLLAAPGDTSLHFALVDGARPVLNSSFWISDFRKVPEGSEPARTRGAELRPRSVGRPWTLRRL